MLKDKNKAWSIDELQLISDTKGAKIGFNKILCAIDLFSHFVIMQPVCDHLDGKQVADFIQLKIIAVFGVPKIIVTDNATSMSNTLVTSACAVLGIRKTTISPYSAKSNLQELSNRFILDTISAFTVNH